MSPGLRLTSVHALVVLLGLDTFFIAAHVLTGLRIYSGEIDGWPSRWYLGSDWSLSERFMHVKWAALSVILFAAAVAHRSLLLLVLGATFLVLLLDDALLLHERAGEAVARATGLAARLGDRAPFVVEVVYFAAGGTILGALALAGWRAASSRTRDLVKPMAYLFGALIACGVGVDFVHQMAAERSLLDGLLGTIEDGGELVIASVLLAYAIGAFRARSGAWAASGAGGRGA